MLLYESQAHEEMKNGYGHIEINQRRFRFNLPIPSTYPDPRVFREEQLRVRKNKVHLNQTPIDVGVQKSRLRHSSTDKEEAEY